MSLLVKLNPLIRQGESIDEGMNQSKVFKNLSRVDQAIVILATAIIAILTLDYYTDRYFSLLMNRFSPVTPDIKLEKSISKSDLILTSGGKKLREELEREFWCYVTKNKEFYGRFQIVLNSGEDKYKKASYLLDIYFKKLGLDSSIECKEKSLLIDSIAEQISSSIQQFNRAVSSYTLPINQQINLKIYPTRGDGSCGFHAVKGEWSRSVYRCENIVLERQKFCDWLKCQHVNKQLPPKIFEILTNYFLDFDYAPASFRRTTSKAHADIKIGFDELSDDEQRKRIEDFIANPLVIDAYIEHLKKVSTFLLQDELIAIGEYYGLRVLLFQPGWGHDSDKTSCNILEALNPDFQLEENDVCVYFSGNHYERARLENNGIFQIEQ